MGKRGYTADLFFIIDNLEYRIPPFFEAKKFEFCQWPPAQNFQLYNQDKLNHQIFRLGLRTQYLASNNSSNTTLKQGKFLLLT